MARRLVEAGCPFVTVVLENPYVSGLPFLDEGTYNWDSHAVNCHLFRDARVRFPIYDQTITALIEDIHNRGLDQRGRVTDEAGVLIQVLRVEGRRLHGLSPVWCV